MSRCMTTGRVMVTSAAFSIAAAATAAAQDLPAWSIAEICAKEPAQCQSFEGQARQTVSGGWSVLPEAYRKACLAEIKSPLDRSWRLLSQCIELQVLKGLDKETIATAASPAEPVPPPQPAVPAANAIAAPPPPFGLPLEPPKAD